MLVHSESFEALRLTEDWDHFHVLMEQMLHRIPSLGDATIDKLIYSPETFSPDCKWIMGEAPEVRDLEISITVFFF